MKVLHLSLDPSASQPGKQTVFYNMLAEFSNYWDRIDLFCPKTNNGVSRIIHQNVHVHPSPWHFLFQSLFIIYQGRKLVKKRPYDLIILHSCPPFLTDFGAIILSKFYKIPIIYEVFHIVGYPKSASLLETAYKWMTFFWLKISQSCYHSIRVINALDTYPVLIHWGIPKHKIKLIPAFYIDSKIFKPRHREKRLNSVLFVARLVRNKGIFETLTAIKIARASIPQIKLTIVGTGSLRNKIIPFISDNKLEDNIRLIGFLKTQRQLSQLYNRSQALVMTSYNEGGPRVVLEAMACALAVVATPVGLVREVIKHKVNGLIVSWDPEDIAQKLVYLLKNKKISRQMGSQAILSVKKYPYKKMIRNLAVTYQSLIKSTKIA